MVATTSSLRKAAIHERYGFIHIPKTGGSSLVSTLQRDTPDIVCVAGPYDLANFPETLADVPILAGHIPYFMFRWEERPRKPATILRDPVQRVLSNYRYIRATPGHYAHKYFDRFHPTLAQCFDHPVLRIEFTDFQTKMLGFAAREHIVWPAHGATKYKNFTSEYSAFLYCEATANMLATARERLLTEIQFACLDRPASLLALCSRMCGLATSGFDTTNRTPYVSWTPSDRDLEATIVHNTLDRALYDYALGLIDGQIHPAPLTRNRMATI